MPANPAAAVEAERALLAAALQAPHAIKLIRRLVITDDFWQPRHAAIYRALTVLDDADTRIDPVMVLAEINRAGEARLVGDAPYLGELYGLPVVNANIEHYATQLRECSAVRALDASVARLDQYRRELGGDFDKLMTHVAHETIRLEQIVDAGIARNPITGVHPWEDFLAHPDRPEDWIVPGLLERKDVWMILGAEGGGKSWLSRQLCMAIAAGVHPFRPHQRIQAHRTLLVDIENPESMVRRQSRGLYTQVCRLGEWKPGTAHVWLHPAGLNLRKLDDQQLLEQVIAETEPELIAFGSLYKAYQQGSDSWEAAAEDVRAVFDKLRARYNVALWLEHHMPKGSGDDRPGVPYGSSVWMRWAAFGRIIDRVGENAYELKRFRGDRDVREVPVGLVRGAELPWGPIWDEDELDFLRDKKPKDDAKARTRR